jgi:hypothetical protein
LVASDPGRARLINALAAALSIGVSIAVEYGFAQLAHPLWIAAPPGRPLPAPHAAMLAAQHHRVTELSMLLGAIVALMSSFVNGPTPRNRAVTVALLPVPFLAMLALGIELSPDRTLGLIVFTLVVAVGTYARKFIPRFGPRAFTWGNVLFVGYLFGFLAGRQLALDQLGWLAAIAWLAVAANIVLRGLIYDPITRGLLSRSSRSFAARARTAIGAAIDLLDARTCVERRHRARRLRRQLVRLNEAALMIDAQLADPQFQPQPDAANGLHEQLFELELLIHNVGRVVERLAASKPPLEVLAAAHDWLVEPRAGDTTGAAQAARQLCARRDDVVPSALDERTTDRLYALAGMSVRAGDALEDWGRVTPKPTPRTAAQSGSGGAQRYESPITVRPDGRLRGSPPSAKLRRSTRAGTGYAPGCASAGQARVRSGSQLRSARPALSDRHSRSAASTGR